MLSQFVYSCDLGFFLWYNILVYDSTNGMILCFYLFCLLSGTKIHCWLTAWWQNSDAWNKRDFHFSQRLGHSLQETSQPSQKVRMWLGFCKQQEFFYFQFQKETLNLWYWILLLPQYQHVLTCRKKSVINIQVISFLMHLHQ